MEFQMLRGKVGFELCAVFLFPLTTTREAVLRHPIRYFGGDPNGYRSG